jgi:hypothetical protein
MAELYDDLAVELDSFHVQGILEAREWRSTGFIYIFIVDSTHNKHIFQYLDMHLDIIV